MNRDRRWYGSWGHFLTGVAIGLVVVTPAFAAPPSLPIVVNDDLRLYLLIGSGVLLLAALIGRLMRSRDTIDVEPGVVDAPRGYGMRFFPADRPIALE